MNWNYEDSGEFGVTFDVDGEGYITTDSGVAGSKNKTITHIKAPNDNEDATKWDTLFTSLKTLFGFQGELRYWRGKAVIE